MPSAHFHRLATACALALALPVTAHAAIPDTLRMDERLDVRVTFAGGVHGTLYRGTMDGEPVVVTQTPDYVDVTRHDGYGVDVTRFTADGEELQHFRVGDARPVDLAPVIQEADPPHPGRAKRSVEGHAAPSVDIEIFLHDDIASTLSREQFHAAYVAWWLADADRVLPFADIHLHYHTLLPGITDTAPTQYKALDLWSRQVQDWARTEDFDASHTHKYLLVSAAPPAGAASGLAWQGGDAAIASIKGRYRVVAHELGHLFDARHEDGEVRYQRGWWCETNMYPGASVFRGNCYRYSDENERRMRAYLIEHREASDAIKLGPLVMD